MRATIYQSPHQLFKNITTSLNSNWVDGKNCVKACLLLTDDYLIFTLFPTTFAFFYHLDVSPRLFSLLIDLSYI